MISRRKRKTFSVARKRPIYFRPNREEAASIRYFSELISENFSMSEELAKAIGTVVVQALTENARDSGDDTSGSDDFGGGDDFGFDDDLFGDEETENLPESKKDSGEVEEAEGPKAAPDLSQDFAELQSTVNNHSVYTPYDKIKEFLNFSDRMHYNN